MTKKGTIGSTIRQILFEELKNQERWKRVIDEYQDRNYNNKRLNDFFTIEVLMNRGTQVGRNSRFY